MLTFKHLHNLHASTGVSAKRLKLAWLTFQVFKIYFQRTSVMQVISGVRANIEQDEVVFKFTLLDIPAHIMAMLRHACRL